MKDGTTFHVIGQFNVVIDFNIAKCRSSGSHVTFIIVPFNHLASKPDASTLRMSQLRVCRFDWWSQKAKHAPYIATSDRAHQSNQSTHLLVMATLALSLSTRHTFWNSSMTSPSSTYLQDGRIMVSATIPCAWCLGPVLDMAMAFCFLLRTTPNKDQVILFDNKRTTPPSGLPQWLHQCRRV